MGKYIGEGWVDILYPAINQSFMKIHEQMVQRRARIPHSYMDIFAPLRTTPPDKVKAIVIGEG